MKKKTLYSSIRKANYRLALPTAEEMRRKSNKNLCRDLKPFVEGKIGEPIDEVIGYDDYIEYDGVCDTCSFERIAVRIIFTIDDEVYYYGYTGKMSDLLMEVC